MALHSQALLLPHTGTSISNAQLNKLYRPHFVKLKWLTRRPVVASAAPRRNESRKEIRLNQDDLMALEFGRLLGESKEKTISKVLRKKIDPNATYIGIEKQKKGAKDFINNADFSVNVERPTGPSGNGSTFSSDLPPLASRPARQNGSSVSFPNLGTKAALYNDTDEISVDESVLRKPSFNQGSKAVLPLISRVASNVKRPSFQSKLGLNEDGEDLERLRRPSILKQQEANNGFMNTSKSVTEFSSQLEAASTSDYCDSMEVSKLEFQRLLDESFDASLPSNPSNLVFPRATQRNSSMDSVQAAQRGSKLKLSSPKRPQSQMISSQSDQVALPSVLQSEKLAGLQDDTLLGEVEEKTAAVSSVESPTGDVLRELLIRKPKDSVSDDVKSSSLQFSKDIYKLDDGEAYKSSNASLQNDLEKASGIPQLATPPSRHKGSFGTFVAPPRGKFRGIEFPKIESVDEAVDESLLRKPHHLEKERESINSTILTEADTAPVSFSPQMQLKDKPIDDSLLHRSLTEVDTTQMDVNSSNVPNGSKRDRRCQLEGKAFSLRSQADLGPISQEEVSPSKASIGLDGAIQGSNDIHGVLLSRGLQEGGHSSGEKSVKVTALKKPVKVSPSDSKVYATDGKSAQIDSSLAVNSSSDIMLQSRDLSVNQENDELDTGSDLKALQNEYEAEESSESQSCGEPTNVAGIMPGQVSVEGTERDQATNEQSPVAVVEANKATLNEEVAEEQIVDNLLQQSKKMLRRPSQLTLADLSTQNYEQMDLQASNIKLHQAKEEEEKEWARAEALLKSKEQVEVKLIGSNSAGLFVSFGCLVGFLPSFELSSKRGLVDFASWAQKNDIDLSLNDGFSKSTVKSSNESGTIQSVEHSRPSTSAEDELNELKHKYKEEVSKLMSGFVEEKTKVVIKLLDKSRRKLKFSEKEADPGCREHVQKKANLMAELKLGDVVTCEVKSITPIGVFVEVDGVPALIHHSEVSWNTRAEPAALLNVGQVIKTKVCRLDRTLQRINLSLKQMQTDPLKRTLESVVGDLDSDSSICELEAVESTDAAWPELEELITKLEKMDQISSASRGRCLNSSAFAPTFQVLISTSQSNGHKLLARYGNKIQEILVDTTLDRDKMKDCIRICTFSDA